MSYPERLILSSSGWKIKSVSDKRTCRIDLDIGPEKKDGQQYYEDELVANREYTVLRTTPGSSVHYPIDFDHVTNFHLEVDIAVSDPECRPQMWRYGDWQALIPLAWRFGTWQDMMLDEISFEKKEAYDEDSERRNVYSMSLKQGPLVSGSYVMYLPPHPTKEKVEPADIDETFEGDNSDEQENVGFEDVHIELLFGEGKKNPIASHPKLKSRKLRSMFESSNSAPEPEINHMYGQLLALKNLEYDTTRKCEYRMQYTAPSSSLGNLEAPLRVEAHFDNTIKDCTKVKLPPTSL